jgi:hypothetical protein
LCRKPEILIEIKDDGQPYEVHLSLTYDITGKQPISWTRIGKVRP